MFSLRGLLGVMLLLCIWGAAVPGTARGLFAAQRAMVTELDYRQARLETLEMVKRIPRVPMALVKEAGSSFLTTAQVMVPVGLIINIRSLFSLKWKTWLTLSGKLGVEWATISGLFAGGESLFKTLRGKEDRWNVYLGSGLASAVMRAKEGPIGSIQGFAAGFAFVYAIDQFLPEENMPSVPGVARGVGAAKMPPVARRSAAAAAVKRYKRF